MSKTILMLEDDEMIAEIYQKQLEKAGFKVAVMSEGAKVADKIKNEEPDIALLDLLIPDGGGIEILKRLQGWEGKTKKIIFSNNQDPESEQEAMSLGASAFLIKADFTPAKLVETITKFL